MLLLEEEENQVATDALVVAINEDATHCSRFGDRLKIYLKAIQSIEGAPPSYDRDRTLDFSRPLPDPQAVGKKTEELRALIEQMSAIRGKLDAES